MSESPRVADWFADLLETEGVDCVFTVPGGTAVPLMEAVSRRRSIRIVVAKDEAGAAYAADGYAWVTRKPGVVITIGGPGATNALTGLFCAAAQGNPVVLISGDVSCASMGRRSVQDGSDLGMDVLAASRAATAVSVSGAGVGKAEHALLEAFRRALSSERPVHVSLPLDVQTARASVPCPDTPAAYRAGRFSAHDAGAVERAARVLVAAERCCILAGVGALDAGPELRRVAERLNAAVATTCGAKSVFPEDHPLAVGVFSFGSGSLARAALTGGSADVLLAVGTGLGEFATMNFSSALRPRGTLIQIDRDPGAFGRNYPVLSVLGDAKTSLSALAERLGASNGANAGSWLAELNTRHARWAVPEALESGARPIRPERVMSAIQRALPPNACVIADIGTSCLFVAHYLRLVPPQRCYIPMGWSAMAHPLGASLGIRLGSDAPTLCVTGDAAFLSKGLELHAAVEAGLGNFVWVVLSNRGHGLVRLGTEKLLGKGHGVEAGDFRTQPDAAAIARAVGAVGLTVEDPSELDAALELALGMDRPVVVDVSVEPDAEPPMADRIQGLRTAAGLAAGERSEA